MPESPEVLFNAILLNKILKHTKITHANSTNETRQLHLPSHSDNNIIGVFTKGKLMWLTIKKNEHENYYIHIHLGTKGKLEHVRPANHIRYEMKFIDSKNHEFPIYLEDSDFRQLARITIQSEEEHNKIISELGTSIFSPDFTKEFFKTALKSKNTKLISLLMNQHTFSGIGNYIKNDSFYLADIPIDIKTKTLTDEQIDKLYDSIMLIAYSVLMTHLREFNDLKDLGITLQDDIFKNMPTHVEVPYVYKIYRREETVDGKKVKKIKVDGRDTYIVGA